MTSSWPWMKGIDCSIVDPPIAPTCPEDIRPAVKELIAKHATKIAKIKSGLVDDPLYDETKHDDLWVLRFWMSHKKTKSAIDAAKKTFQFRAKYRLDEQDIRRIPPHKVSEGKVKEFMSHWEEDAMLMTVPDKERGVICFIRMSSINQHAVVKNLNEEYWLPNYMYYSEWTYQWVDYVTRTAGRLTKSIRLIDSADVSLSTLNGECMKRDGRAMAVMEDNYPQMLETVFFINPPSFVRVLWNVGKVILPKRVFEKFDIIDPQEKEQDRKRLCRHISEENLPEELGGKNTVSVVEW